MADDMDSTAQKFPQTLDSRKSSSSHVKVDPVQKSSSRHSPLAPLVSLEYLKNQRRGSITDPSLHAAASNNHSSIRQLVTPVAGSSSIHDTTHRNSASDVRPTSPYVFGDATAHSADYSHQQIRKLLRSPSTEGDNNNHTSPASPREHSQSSHEPATRTPSAFSPPAGVEAGPGKFSEMDHMNVDASNKLDQQLSPLSIDQGRHIPNRESHQFDYNMRRHSIAVGQDPHMQYSGSQLSTTPHGTKRKMSSDRSMFAPVGEEIDPQLVGPGVPSAINMDTEAPAPKRRGSAIDTQRIAQLSLYDRRNSVDSRGSSAVQWWINDRRDSTSSSMFSSPSSVGYGSGFSADSPHGRPAPGIAAFAWSTNQPPEQVSATQIQNDADATMSGPPRQYDPTVSQMSMMPPINFAPDRRMSVPDNATTTLPSGPTRILRSRSRPPSRQLRSADAANPSQSGHSSSSNTAQEDPSSAPSPSSSGKQTTKESSSTPYSRSPELRVSHKLAERKRRKEMKDLFDELRDQLPADRGMKASKWEILSKAIDFVSHLKQSHQDMLREIDMLRHELDSIRQGGMPAFTAGGPPHPVVYSQAPVVPAQYAPGAVQQHPPPPHPHPPQSRPSSSQNAFSPGGGPTGPQTQNGSMNRVDASPT